MTIPSTFTSFLSSFVSNGASFGRKNYYQPLRRNGSSAALWLAKLVSDGWHLNEEADGANSDAFIVAHTDFVAVSSAYEAQTGNDLFTPMEVAATPNELHALYSAYAKSPALLIPYDSNSVVRSFQFVPTQYLNLRMSIVLNMVKSQFQHQKRYNH